MKMFPPSSSTATYSGLLQIHLSDPPEIGFGWCLYYTEFSIPNDVVVSDVMEWRLTKTQYPEVSVFCNNVEVFKVTMSDDTCVTDFDGVYRWNEFWSNEIGRLEFSGGDTASISYRGTEGELVFGHSDVLHWVKHEV